MLICLCPTLDFFSFPPSRKVALEIDYVVGEGKGAHLTAINC